MGYGLGLLALLAIKVLAPAYYAREQMAIPVKISVIALIVNLGLSLLLIDSLAHLGLALAVSGAAVVNAILLWAGLRYYRFYEPRQGWWRLWLQSLLATAGMAGVLWQILSSFGDMALMSGMERTGVLLFLVVSGLFSYALLILMLGFRLKTTITNQ
jgi:putative peptidoglycan lipid II flippase